MTIHYLLTHTSGLSENEWENFYKGRCTPYTTDEQVKTFRDRPLGFQPGTSWKYRNTDYYLLAFIIEKLSGESYAMYLAHHIFEPLKMAAFGLCNDGGYGATEGRRMHSRGQHAAPPGIF
jgi:D-alanyl-D-alanine carboxypeptidase